MNPIQLSASVELIAAAGEPTKLKILAYAGGQISPPGWGEVIVDLAATKLPDSIPILGAHENDLESIIASGRPKNDGRTISVVAKLADTPAAQLTRSLLEGGHPLQASVGIEPSSTRFHRAGEEVSLNGRTFKLTVPTTVIAGQLREVSIMPVGADADTSVSLAATRGNNMSQTMNTDATALERRRITAIDSMAGDLPEIRARAIAEGWDLQQTELQVLRAKSSQLESAKMQAEYERRLNSMTPAPNGFNHGSHPSGVTDRDILTAAFMMRAGYTAAAEKRVGAKAVQAAEDLRTHSLIELFRAGFQMKHIAPPSDRNDLIRAAFSTTDIPEIVSNAMNKVALEEYAATPATWRSFCRITPGRDFKPSKHIRLVVGESYEFVGNGGELKHGTLENEYHTVQIDTKGRMFVLTRDNVINDDLGLISDLSTVLGRMGIRCISDEIYKLLLLNKNSAGADYFSTAHGNLIEGADTILSAAGLSQLRLTLATQVDAKGNPIDVTAKTLVVPPELEVPARQLLNSELMARDTSEGDQLPSGNPFRNTMTLEVESRLSNANFSGNSATAYYAFAAPVNAPVIVSFLDGRDQPIIETAPPPFQVLGIGFRGYIDFGAALADHSAAVMATGVA